MKRYIAVCVVVAMWVSLPAAGAEVKLAGVFGDGMVLQRGMKVPIWGWADGGAKVTVTFAGQSKTAAADNAGKWMVTLDPLTASAKGRSLTVQTLLEKRSGPKITPATPMSVTIGKLVVADVLVGDVWLCSGQSNMAMTVSGSVNAEAEIAAAKFPAIRHFRVGANASGAAVQPDCRGKWEVCSAATAGRFTAAGFYFARHLHKALDVPVGLVNSSWGGTCIEAWTSIEALRATHPGREMIADFKAAAGKYDPAGAKKRYAAAQARYAAALAKYKASRKAGTGKGRPPRRPRPPVGPDKNPNGPAALYNGMIAPIVPLAIRGAIWYQGERNTRTNAYGYRQLLPGMIVDWRQRWGKGAGADKPYDFPFFFVQLPNFVGRGGDEWPVIRESFLKSLSVPKTGMAVTIDVGDLKDIHPKNKQAVGRRLALSALAVAYGRDVAFSGPVYKSMRIEGGSIRLEFTHLAGGLAARGGGNLTGFAIAGADRKFAPAEAVIAGKTVLVRAAAVGKPVAVRYAWANDPTCNLTNSVDLPAGPFRTDIWPVVSQPVATVIGDTGAIIWKRPKESEIKILEEMLSETSEVYVADKSIARLGTGGWPRAAVNTRVRLIRLKYAGGDWDRNMGKGGDYNMLLYFKKITGLAIADNTESKEIERLGMFAKGKAPPLVTMTGSRGISVSDRQVKVLRRYCLDEGGMLLVDCGGGQFDRSFRALCKQVFTDKKLVEIPNDDPIFRQPFVFSNGAPPLWHHAGNRALGVRHRGRWVVFYHPGDMGSAWRTGHSGASKAVAERACKLGINIMYYAFTRYLDKHHSTRPAGKAGVDK